MTELEHRLLALLSSACECLAQTERHWSGMMGSAADRGRRLFNHDSDAKIKYDFVKSIEDYYGTMGSFSDISIPAECPNIRSDLYKALRDLLRAYWGELGREWHD